VFMGVYCLERESSRQSCKRARVRARLNLNATHQPSRAALLTRTAHSLQAVLEFPVACGITIGTPVRVRGVRVGNVLSVRPSLECVDVLVEVRGETHTPRPSSYAQLFRAHPPPMHTHTPAHAPPCM